jgi:GT2 family glycosyltransferase
MIVIYHNGKNAVGVRDERAGTDLPFGRERLSQILCSLAAQNPGRIIAWCHEAYRPAINIAYINDLFAYKQAMFSFDPNVRTYIPEAIGYVEESVFIKINKGVSFPTWRMSTAVGALHATVLNGIRKQLANDKDFGYFLCSFAKLAMPLGIFCYSEPQLLNATPGADLPIADYPKLFRFVKQHYRAQWVFLLLLNVWVFEKKLPLLAAIRALFYKRRSLKAALFVAEKDMPKFKRDTSFDVVIPTIGRKKYLYDFLKDLASQSQLPGKVIIVEQNPADQSISELDYLNTDFWPFEIRHFFTQQAGACNARNIALHEVGSNWIFLADDDIRIEAGFIEEVFAQIARLPNHVFNICCLQPGQAPIFSAIHQTSIFGSGCSFISAESLGSSEFNRAFEFGYGEDGDFGGQLLDKGFDIIYLPSPAILHLKAPIGGFRTKPGLLWKNDPIQPKPSPYVMLYKMLHKSREQQLGYKSTLFFKFYRVQPIKNPFIYYRRFKEQWSRSLHWANILRHDS